MQKTVDQKDAQKKLRCRKQVEQIKLQKRGRKKIRFKKDVEQIKMQKRCIKEREKQFGVIK